MTSRVLCSSATPRPTDKRTVAVYACLFELGQVRNTMKHSAGPYLKDSATSDCTFREQVRKDPRGVHSRENLIVSIHFAHSVVPLWKLSYRSQMSLSVCRTDPAKHWLDGTHCAVGHVRADDVGETCRRPRRKGDVLQVPDIKHWNARSRDLRRTPNPFSLTRVALSPRSSATAFAPENEVAGSYCAHLSTL